MENDSNKKAHYAKKSLKWGLLACLTALISSFSPYLILSIILIPLIIIQMAISVHCVTASSKDMQHLPPKAIAGLALSVFSLIIMLLGRTIITMIMIGLY